MEGESQTWARSPSYLYSQVNFLFSNLSRTSPIALVGLASIGLSGTPGVNLQVSRSLSMPASRIAGMTLSYVGSSLQGPTNEYESRWKTGTADLYTALRISEPSVSRAASFS
jgi:hypothetical protein